MNERIFVVSDLHGIKSVYDGITNYLDELALCNPEDNIKLIINGDIIDRGPNSIEMLKDVIDRKNNKKGYFEMDMLAGNHELMMYEALQLKDKLGWLYTGKLSWFIRQNGGIRTAIDYDGLNETEQKNIISFLDKLELQKSFEKEMLNTKGVIVAHACASSMIKFLSDQFNIKYRLEDIKEDIKRTYLRDEDISTKYFEYLKTVWYRKSEEKNLGLRNYLTIIGHTPVMNYYGYDYDEENKVLNIDGGCAKYAYRRRNDVTVPLLELDFKNKEVIINRFNSEGKQLGTHILTEKGIKKENNKMLKI